jgi:DNA-directed RNA polymerase subunit RPC12/RpoP
MQAHTSVRVVHDVDAVCLEDASVLDTAYSEMRRGSQNKDDPKTIGGPVQFDAICWNHPHLGTEDCKVHRYLLLHFLHSAISRLKDSGCIIVSLVEGQGERWEIEEAAKKFDFFLESCTVFDTSAFPGYACKRNTHGKSFKNSETQRQWLPGQSGDAASKDMMSFVYRFRHVRHRRVSVEIVDERSASRTCLICEVPKTKTKSVLDLAASFTCTDCGKAFRSKQGLQTHVRQVHDLRLYEKIRSKESIRCRYCPREFHDREALWQHIVNKHAEEGETEAAVIPSTATLDVSCRLPEEGAASHLVRDRPVWKRKADGNRGQVEGMSPGYYACPICSQSVPLGWTIKEHLETLQPILGLNAECEFCHKKFIEHRALKQHLRFCQIRLREGEPKSIRSDLGDCNVTSSASFRLLASRSMGAAFVGVTVLILCRCIDTCRSRLLPSLLSWCYFPWQ